MERANAASPEPALPERIGDYEVLAKLGRGGMATVLLARWRGAGRPGGRREGPGSLSRLYALKLLRPELTEQQKFIHMLLDEARMASHLYHPNAVAAVDVGQDGEHHYLVMEYVKGVALDRLLKASRGRRPPEVFVPIIIDALRGLHAAHELVDREGRALHLIHRDVTPGNVLVGLDGVGRITDFGVAKAKVKARLTKTNPGVVKGKAGYIAPEVLLGRKADARADVFSAGVMLFNVLTGRSMFNKEDLMSTVSQLFEGGVAPPSTVGLAPPAIFDPIVLRGVEGDPEKRFPDALSMATALNEALAEHIGPADPSTVATWVSVCYQSPNAAADSAPSQPSESEVMFHQRASALEATRQATGQEAAAGTEQPTLAVHVSSATPPAETSAERAARQGGVDTGTTKGAEVGPASPASSDPPAGHPRYRALGRVGAGLRSGYVAAGLLVLVLAQAVALLWLLASPAPPMSAARNPATRTDSPPVDGRAERQPANVPPMGAPPAAEVLDPFRREEPPTTASPGPM